MGQDNKTLSGGIETDRWTFRSLEEIGTLQGETGIYGQGRTINGFFSRSWFFGLGAGLDFYRFSSVPLFLSASKDVLRWGRGSFFLNAEGGTNLPVHNPSLPRTFYSPGGGDVTTSDKLYAGPYGGAGFGYLFPLTPKSLQALSIRVGYSYKELKETISGMSEGVWAPPIYNNIHNDYRLNRFSIEVGWRFR